MKALKVLVLLVSVFGCVHLSVSEYDLGKPHNRQAVALPDWDEMLSISYRYLFETQINQIPSESIPVQRLTAQDLHDLPDDQISAIRFGHSTVLLKVGGEYWLTDPVFSDRLGPIYTFGTERFHDVPLSASELPEIKGVLISHNHYDHLDELTIKDLHSKVERFFVPLGNGEVLLDWGVDPEKIIELDWWQSSTLDEFTITATPANHLSGRKLFDQNEALWSSWVLRIDNQAIFFSGDSGFSEIYQEIGERYGPFDLTLMENGSYDHGWKREHLTPEQTVQAHIDLKGTILLPIHNSTFDLAFHPWNEPMKKVSQLSQERGVNLRVPRIGEPLTIDRQDQQLALLEPRHWWNIK